MKRKEKIKGILIETLPTKEKSEKKSIIDEALKIQGYTEEY
jgi:hypothetical protein